MVFDESGLRLLQALPGGACVIDSAGDCVATNSRWQESIYQYFGIAVSSDNYLEHCRHAVEQGNDYALKLILNIREIFQGERCSYKMTFPFRKEGGTSWFKLTASAYGENAEYAILIFDDISENIETVQALRDSEERYTQQFRHVLSGIIISSPDGSILDVNPAACKILGYPEEELKKKGLGMIEGPDTEAGTEGDHPQHASAFEGKKIFIHKNGTEIPVEISSVQYRGKQGELLTINMFRDKSEVKKAEKKLQEEKRFTSLAVNSIPGAFYVMDENHNLMRWNRALFEDLGYNEDEIQNTKIIDFIAEKDRSRVRQVMDDIFESGTGHVVAEVKTSTRDVRNYHFYANRFDSNGKQYIVGTGMDITGLVDSEKERFENYELLSQLFANSPIAMVMINPKNAILKVNESFSSLFGYSGEEVIGGDVDEFIAMEDQLKETRNVSKVTFSGECYQKETIRYNKAGEEIPVLLNSVPITNNGKVIAIYGIYVDLRNQKKLEKEIQKSLYEKEVLLQEVHHRVKNNLAIIAGLLDLQIMDELNTTITQQLNEVRSRIYSIAKIHEILYQEDDVVSIRFDKYLKTISNHFTYNRLQNEITSLNVEAGPLTLNLNQAVPCGLVINELLNIILSGANSPETMVIRLNSNNEKVELRIEGEGLAVQLLQKNKCPKTFQGKLINIFLSQMGGVLEMSENHRNAIVIRFKKAEQRGSSSSIKNSEELYYKD